MLDSLLNKDMIIRKEFLKIIILENPSYCNFFNFISENLLKIKSLDSFISGIILMNPRNYFGTYSLDYNKDIKKTISQKKRDQFLKTFVNTYTRKIFKNNLLDQKILDEINSYYNAEKDTYFYLYQKKFYDISYTINMEKIQNLKKEIYELRNLNLESKFFSQSIIMNVKKGKDLNQIILFDSLVEIIKGKNINSKLKDYILTNYNTEYLFVKNYL